MVAPAKCTRSLSEGETLGSCMLERGLPEMAPAFMAFSVILVVTAPGLNSIGNEKISR